MLAHDISIMCSRPFGRIDNVAELRQASERWEQRRLLAAATEEEDEEEITPEAQDAEVEVEALVKKYQEKGAFF